MLRRDMARKRKRGGNIMAVYNVPYKKRKTTSKAFIPGVDRTGGYYGRFSGRSGELKFHDVDLDDATVGATGNMTATINIIPQGVTESQRVGRKCTIKSVNWHFRLILPERDAVSNPGDPDIVRTILFIDKQANGATATVTDILETTQYLSFRNLANSGRFKILYDKNHTMNYGAMASDGAGVVSQARVVKDVNVYKSCSIPIEFSGTTGVIGEIRSNNFGVLLISSESSANFTSKFRLRFSDN